MINIAYYYLLSALSILRVWKEESANGCICIFSFLSTLILANSNSVSMSTEADIFTE